MSTVELYTAPAVTNPRQRQALRAVAQMDLAPHEMRHAIIFAENITADGGVDVDNLPLATRYFMGPIIADWLEEPEE